MAQQAIDEPDSRHIREVVANALAEDVGAGDVTSLAVIPESVKAGALMVAREDLVLAGLALAEETFRAISPRIEVERVRQDGERAHLGDALLKLRGSARAMLTAERVALNFVQRLSGVATLTSQFVAAVHGTSARILDTRKTTPGLRILEKYAVRCGGGSNHRVGLFDMILIKDNHLAAIDAGGSDPIQVAVKRARAAYPNLKVEVEADTLEQVDQALGAAADVILLDNMTIPQLTEAVRRCRGRARTEASGGVTISTVRGIAETGVDLISVGALTHSARAVDVALDFELQA
jgi:nicotinate-nucleotide pyrophosphorylase (carboxylating)